MAQQNPVLDVINSLSRPIEGMSAAARTGSMAGQSFEKGASLMLKLDNMFNEEEARLQNNMFKSQEMLQRQLKINSDNHFKEQQATMQVNQFNALQTQRGTVNQLNRDQLEETKRANDIKANSPSKNMFKNYSDAYDKVVKRHTTTNMFGDEIVDQQGIENDDVYKVMKGYTGGVETQPSTEQPVTQPVNPAAPVQLGPTVEAAAAGNTIPATQAPSTLQTNGMSKAMSSAWQTVTTDPTKTANALTLGNEKVSEGTATIFMTHPMTAATPAGSHLFTAGFLSTNKDTRTQFDAAYRTMPAQVKQIVGATVKPNAMQGAILDTSSEETKYNIPNLNTNTQLGTEIKSALYSINKSYGESGTIVDMLENTDWATGALHGALAGIGIGKSGKKKAALLADRMSRDDKAWKNATGTFPNAISSIWLSKEANTFWTSHKTGNFGWGTLGTNLKEFATPWRQEVSLHTQDSVGADKNEPTTLAEYMLPKGISIKIDKINKDHTKKSDDQIYKSYQESLKNMQANYTQEDRIGLSKNIVSITSALTKAVADKGYAYDGTIKLNADDNTAIKVKLYNTSTGKMDLIEAAPVQLAQMVQAMLQGGLKNAIQ